ncbi:hypothetical protein H257_12863 [Aphanomyces astaci]|uniref:Tc1-like transposase DDE domain-containing protein n=1 Tax=Aphanomyces astaci TaxID=112090 RepID=W4FZJ9_APHAT|nr:hypothetical protein H257_12863 [Aphanomyces astaci]ETV72073.1 hypothetical protein H257_12863 [Aphanomyces astaci]|eukprot:XP_009838516.1 hypothetical protein H257_12863 [Aphanomyces astaci]
MHRSETLLAFLDEQNINLFEHSVLFPDLNAIENVWGMMVQYVNAIPKTIVTSDERQPTNLRGTWLIAKRVLVQEHATTFQYDGADGWHYCMAGSRHLIPMKLRAYLFRNHPAHPTSTDVIATVSSMPFFVMSYRPSCKACQASTNTRDASRDRAGVFRLSDGLQQGVLAHRGSQSEMLPLTPSVAPPATADHEHLVAMVVMGFRRTNVDTTPPQYNTNTTLLSTSITTKLCMDIAVVLAKYRSSLQAFLQQHATDILDQRRLWLGYEQ